MDNYITFLAPDISVIGHSILLIVLLTASALASGSEAAFFSLTHKEVSKIKINQGSTSKLIIKLLSKSDYLLASILIANNLINISVVIVSDKIINSLVKFNSTVLEFVFKTVIVTFILLLFGEIIPKIMATRSPVKFSHFMAKPLSIAIKILSPLAYLLIRSSSKIKNAVSHVKPNLSIDQLSDALKITDTTTVEDKKMLSGIIRFVGTEVSEIMRPRVDVVAIDMEDDFENVKQIIKKSGFSRLPAYTDELDNIKGVLYVKDIIAHLDKKEFNWQSVLRKAYYVPDHKKINDLMEEFQSEKIHLAIVVDEYGSMQGIVSLEDILEEIVGEISDESDKMEKMYVKVNNDTYIFEGKVHISDFRRILDLDDELFEQERGDAESLAGLLLEVNRDFLSEGDEITLHDIKFIVDKINNHRIEKVKIVLLTK